MIRIIDRYLLKELLPPFILSFIVLIFVFLINQMLRIVELIINRGVGILTVIKLFVYIMLPFLALTLPMAVLISSIISFNRLSADNEIIAIKAAGMNIYRLLPPVLLFSSIIYILTLSFSLWSLPWGGISIKAIAVNMLKDEVFIGLEAGVFNEISKNMIIYVEETPSTSELRGIFISDLRDSEKPTIIAAKKGILVNNRSSGIFGLRLMDGVIHIKGSDNITYQRIIFSTYDFKLDLRKYNETGNQKVMIDEIKKKIKETGGKDIQSLRSLEDYYKNYSFPLSTIIFAILGLPLGLYSVRGGKLGGFAIGILFVIIYYILNIIGDFFVSAGILSPLWAAWFPNISSGAIAIGMFIVAARR
ncbi:MAG: LPS export ABC transporter permease LptF [Nitrospirota bacterium]